MKTGSEYKKTLEDGRATYFEGRRIHDLPNHPLLGQSVELVARGTTVGTRLVPKRGIR